MMHTNLLILILICLSALLLVHDTVFAGVTIPLTSDSSIEGHVTRLSFPSPYQSLRITDVNSIVSRMCIRNTQSDKIYYDARPFIGQSITLPPGEYRISCWSNFGNNIPQSVMIFLSDGTDSIQYVNNSPANYMGTPVNYINAYETYYTSYPPVIYTGYPTYGGLPYYYYNGSGNAGGYYNNYYRHSCTGIRINAIINIR